MRAALGVGVLVLLLFGPAMAQAGARGLTIPAEASSSLPPTSSAPSAADFDWRAMIPYLDRAAGLSEIEGIQLVLENTAPLRAYVAGELGAECRAGHRPCHPNADPASPAAVTARIDSIVRERLSHYKRVASAEYTLTGAANPFTVIGALKSEKHRDAYLVLNFAQHSYTAEQMRAKYGAPTSANVVLDYSLLRYKLDTKMYTARATFTVNSVDGEVSRVAVSVRRKHDHD